MGVAYILAGLLYLFVTVMLIRASMRAARRRNIAGWKFGTPAALVMCLAVFWDWIPTVILHEYYCSDRAGLEVYKTVDEWARDNIGIIDMLTQDDAAYEFGDAGFKTDINQRIVHEYKNIIHIFNIRERIREVYDKETREVIARFTDFDTNISPLGVGAKNLRDYKVWLNIEECKHVQESRDQYNNIVGSLKRLGKNQ